MYAELDAPHHKPHFHAYYQDSQAVFSIDPVEKMKAHYPTDNADWFWLGPKFINLNF
jgi:hypothetical protein